MSDDTESAREQVPWWKGARGEWYVVAQTVLFLVVAFGPRHVPELPEWPGWLAGAAPFAGAALMVAGGTLALLAFRGLGKSLTPLPYPKAGGRLVQSGAYRLVRHPIYCAAIALAVGWALWVRGGLTFGYAVVLLLFFDVKSRREERWLVAKFPEYAAYRQRVRKLIPFVY